MKALLHIFLGLVGLSVVLGGEERKLAKKILADYAESGSRFGRPVKDDKEVMKVTLGLALVTFDIDEDENRLKMTAWPQVFWKDEYLTWDPAEHGGVKQLHLPTDQIFIPDIMLYNAERKPEVPEHVLAVAKSDGSVIFVPPVQMSSTCEVPDKAYRFSCSLKFGSWTFSGEDIDLDPAAETVDLSYLTQNEDWEIEGSSVKKNVDHYDCCPEPYVNLEYTIRFKRRHSHANEL